MNQRPTSSIGAPFGFLGPADAIQLGRMAQALRHRGTRFLACPAHHESTLGWVDHGIRGSASAVYHAPDADLSIALGGYVTGHEWSHVPRPEEVQAASTEVLAELAHQFRCHGPDAFRALRGAYFCAIRDRESIYLVRDGAGVYTGYYGQADGRWLFGPEPKAITCNPAFRPVIRPAAVAQYLSFSFVPEHGTMLQDLFEIPAGHAVRLQPRQAPKLMRYFTFEDQEFDERRADASDQEWVDRFRDAMRDAVRERMSGESTAVFLSGGLDSSVVTAELARHASRPVRTFAIHFGSSYPNELSFARAVARRYGTDHEEVLIQPRDFLPRLRSMIWHLDDPIGDPITQPNYELAAHASRDVKWVFNGEGGDPCFGGPKNLPMMLQHWYGGVPRDPGFRERAYLASYRRAYDEIAYLFTPEFRRRIDPARDLEAVLRPYFETNVPKTFLNKLMSINIRLKGAHLILPKVERMTAAWGLVPLAPLFDERLVRLSFQMPPRMKLRHGVEKVILKQAYRDALPAEVIARPKSGMRVPVHYWFQREMRRYARKILHPRQVRSVGIFDPQRVRQLLDYSIEEGPGRYGLRLWMLLTFEIWRRMVVEREPV